VKRGEQSKNVVGSGDEVEVTFWCLQARFATPGHHPTTGGTRLKRAQLRYTKWRSRQRNALDGLLIGGRTEES